MHACLHGDADSPPVGDEAARKNHARGSERREFLRLPVPFHWDFVVFGRVVRQPGQKHLVDLRGGVRSVKIERKI